MSDFFMVYVDGTEGTKVRHSTLEDATKEAIRLADKTGKRAWVLSPTREVPAPIRTARQLKQAMFMEFEKNGWFTRDFSGIQNRIYLESLLNRLLPDHDQQKDA